MSERNWHIDEPTQPVARTSLNEQDFEPSRLERVLNDIPDGRILQLIFVGMLAAVGYLISFDVRSAIEEQPTDITRIQPSEPVFTEPPKDSDQVRPYLPKSMPAGPRGKKPTMPGFDYAPTSKQLASRMIFRVNNRGEASAVGRIEIGSATDMETFLNGEGRNIKTLSIHSPGGSVRDAIAMARMIRNKSLNTRVPKNAYCASSCPLVYSGGKYRLATPESWIGVHQVYTAPSTIGSIHTGMAAAQKISAECQQLLTDMGVNPGVWIHAMATPSRQLYYFTPRQLSDYKLATRISKKR